MDDSILGKEQKRQVCEICKKHDPTVKSYAEDFELQTSLAKYIEKISGEKVNLADISDICDECYSKINVAEDEREEES